jgi:hypothetical protein
MMDAHVLLAHLRTLLAAAPDFASYTPRSQLHLGWLGKVRAAIPHWNVAEGVTVGAAIDMLPLDAFRETGTAQIFSILNMAISDIELRFGAPEKDQVFGPGAVYDFFRDLRGVIAGAKKHLLIVDPYLDPGLIAYLEGLPASVTVDALLNGHVNRSTQALKAAASKFSAQNGLTVNLRSSSKIHDRVIFIDDAVCWVLGHSIKDAAVNKVTYLAPLAPDITPDKLSHYNAIWTAASPL